MATCTAGRLQCRVMPPAPPSRPPPSTRDRARLRATTTRAPVPDGVRVALRPGRLATAFRRRIAPLRSTRHVERARRPPAMSGQPLRVAVLGAGTVGSEVVRALTRAAGRSWRSTAGPRSSWRGSRSATSTPRSRAACRRSSLTDAPAHLVAVRRRGRRRRADGRRRAGPDADRGGARRRAAGRDGQQARARPSRRRSSRRSPGGPGRRSASRRRSAAGSRCSGRSPATSPATASRRSAASSTGRRTTS